MEAFLGKTNIWNEKKWFAMKIIIETIDYPLKIDCFSQIRLALGGPTYFVQRGWSVGRQKSSDLGFLGRVPRISGSLAGFPGRIPEISGSPEICFALLC